ncbi:MAG TPA: magnesium/cobalt transporter CorA [Pyrinomonadaceae bacterium]|nr:magnesium/cobalt transporter CorA [Pyrinomonadaceae bacterium]
MEIFVYRDGCDGVEEGLSPQQLPELLSNPKNVVWVDVEEPTAADEKILESIFRFHHLTLEDARETRNHPKVEVFPEYLFFIVHGVKNETNSYNFVTKELDGYLGRNYVVTYHHEKFRAIDAVKRQIRSTTYICSRGADYLLHQILDQIVDLYIPIVDDFDNSINDIEDRIFRMKKADNSILEEIMDLKRSVNRLIRISSKQLNVIYRLAHGEFPLINREILPFYRDVYDHLARVSDLAENYRDLVGGLLDIHFSIIANRTNDVMKVMTIFSAIMLPLSLIAGIYGMNFENMPELKTKYGYFIALGSMALVAGGLLIYFWRKGWLFEGGDNLADKDDGKSEN